MECLIIRSYKVLIGLSTNVTVLLRIRVPNNSHVPFTYGVSVSIGVSDTVATLTIVDLSQLRQSTEETGTH